MSQSILFELRKWGTVNSLVQQIEAHGGLDRCRQFERVSAHLRNAAGAFWKAEPERQDYLEHYPLGYTCHFPRSGWKLPRRSGVAT